jgi:hypothetical protein
VWRLCCSTRVDTQLGDESTNEQKTKTQKNTPLKVSINNDNKWMMMCDSKQMTANNSTLNPLTPLDSPFFEKVVRREKQQHSAAKPRGEHEFSFFNPPQINRRNDDIGFIIKCKCIYVASVHCL